MISYTGTPFVGRISVEEIAALYRQRRDGAGVDVARMREVQSMYNGDIIVPLPELNDAERAMVPNRVRQGLQQISNRVASTLPNLACPPLRVGIKASVQHAQDRRRVLLGWWDYSKMRIVLRQRARYFLGYGGAPVEIKWDYTRGIPRWEPVNPLWAFPAPMSSVTDIRPLNCITESSQSLAWLQAHYPSQTSMLYKGAQHQQRPDMQFRLLKYSDDHECVLIVLGPDEAKNDYPAPAPGSLHVELERYENRSGQCPVIIPRMTTLDRPHGQFDGLFGMFYTESMLMALGIVATKRGVFQDEWLVARPGEEPIIEQVPNAAEGIPGIVKGGDLQSRPVDPQFQTNITVDRLAEAQRMTAGLSSELSGVAPSNVRTGRRAQTLLSNTIDFTIQEAQEAFEESLMEENKTAIAFCKAYGGKKTFYVNWKGAQGHITYDPAMTFETDDNIVSYAFPGTDTGGLIIEAGQRIGMGTMSKETFMEHDPMIENVESERDRVRAEQIELAFWSSVQTLAATPEGPWQPIDIAYLDKLIRSDKLEPYEAVEEVQRRAQERQAQVVPAGAPEAQPGLSQPGQGVESIGEPQPSMQNLNSLLMSLRGPQMRQPQER